MELFGIGPLELLLIVLLALIIFGPRDIEKAGRAFGRSLYKLTHSDAWRVLSQASRKIKSLPEDLLREVEKEEMDKRLAVGQVRREDWKMDPHINAPDQPPADDSDRDSTAGDDHHTG